MLLIAASLFQAVGMLSSFAMRMRCTFQKINKHRRNESTSVRMPPTGTASSDGRTWQHDFNPNSQILDFQRNWRLDDCNCCQSVCRENQRREKFLEICDEQNKSGTDQAAEYFKSGNESGNTWIIVSWVLWEPDDKSHQLRAFLDRQHCYIRMNPIEGETEDVYC